MNHQTADERLSEIKQNLALFLSWVIHYSAEARIRLNIIHQCAEKAEYSGDVEEAIRLYSFVHSACRDRFDDFADNGLFGIFTSRVVLAAADLELRREWPISPGPWFDQGMVLIAERECGWAPRGPIDCVNLIERNLPPHLREVIVGDLDEEYVSSVRRKFGEKYALKWYRKQAFQTVIHYRLLTPIYEKLGSFSDSIKAFVAYWFSGKH